MIRRLLNKISQIIFSVPVRIKILGIVSIPVLFLGLSLNYWVTTGLSDWLSYLIPDDRVIVAMEAGGRSVLLVTILAAVAAILLSMMMMFLLTQPLVELSKTANRVAKGDLDSRANIWSQDEIGAVADSLNKMVNHLVKSQDDLKLSNRQLSLLNKIAIASTSDQEIHDTLFVMMKSILDAVKLKTGWIYLYDEERDKFHLATWQGVPDELKPDILNCDTSHFCSCQRELISEQFDQGPKIIDCNRVAEFQGLQISLALPAGEKPLGLINMLTEGKDPLPEEDFELLTISAAQIGEFVSKAWLQMKLSDKEATRQKLMKALIKAQEDERTRIARELHDGAGQMLTSLMLQMKAFERGQKEKETAKKFNHLSGNVSEVIEYIRQISYQNRPVVLEEFGLSQAMENLAEDMVEAAGLVSEVEIQIEQIHMPREIETTIYRIAQESLTNVIRHADASEVKIKMWIEDESLNLKISDDGSGFNVEGHFFNSHGRHLGIKTIKDRLELLGGKLNISSSSGGGTSLHAVLPLLEEVAFV